MVASIVVVSPQATTPKKERKTKWVSRAWNQVYGNVNFCMSWWVVFTINSHRKHIMIGPLCWQIWASFPLPKRVLAVVFCHITSYFSYLHNKRVAGNVSQIESCRALASGVILCARLLCRFYLSKPWRPHLATGDTGLQHQYEMMQFAILPKISKHNTDSDIGFMRVS